MLTMEEAKKIALDDIKSAIDPKYEAVILDEYTLAKPYGWVFIYNSREYFETRNPLLGFGGNGPVVVQHNGRVHRLGSAMSVEESLAKLEAERGWRA
jgi:hypothetical protein